METVLGVSMTPAAVHAILVEGEHAEGATVDTDSFDVSRGRADPAGPDQVVSAILGTRQGATESGCPLASVGVTWTDPTQAAALRDLLADQRIDKIMLVSAFLAAAALTQTVGSATRYAHTALLFVEPSAATMAVVDTGDGSVADVRRQDLPDDDHAAVEALAALAAGAEAMEPRPDGLFVVGSDGVDIATIRMQLEAASSLVVSTPEEPELALARGAALASAHPPLFSSSTAAIAYAQDPATGAAIPHAVGLGYAADAATVERGAEALAYSADPDDAGLPPDGAFGAADVESPWTGSAAAPNEQRTTKPFLVAMSVLGLFVGGVLALVIALAIAIRPHVDTRPQIGAHAVAPAAPPPPPAAPSPAPAAPKPARRAPPPAAPAPAPPAQPPPPPALPLPAPRVPAPAPPGPHGPPIPVPRPPIPAGPPAVPIPHIPLPGIPHL